jgi:hypothetical protein
LAASSGCGGGARQNSPPLVFSDGQVGATSHPLVAKYSINVPTDAAVQVEFGADTTYGRRTSSFATPVGGGTVEMLVAGMKPATTYHMRAVTQTRSGDLHYDSDHTFTTGAVTDMAPAMKVTRTFLTPSPGVELLDFLFANGQLLALVLDLDGNLIWYYKFDPSLGYVLSLRPMPNGHMLVDLSGNADTVLREVDLAGNTVHEVSTADMNRLLAAAGFSRSLFSIHHDALPLANGHLVVLANETRDFTGLAGLPGTTTVYGDVVLDLDSNFQPVWMWSAFDHLDVNRHPMSVADWTHANALVYSPADGALLVSLRHQNWVLKIDYGNGHGSGQILWRLGADGDFALSNGGALDWFYAQHFPTYAGGPTQAPFELALFDNRALTPNGSACATTTGTCYSRPFILTVDENSMTASLNFSPSIDYSFFGGSIGVLANGDVEYASTTVNGAVASRIQEVRRATDEVVWQLDITGNYLYRGFRIPSLYPGVQW